MAHELIGIGITTRHRSSVLSLTIENIVKFKPSNCKIVVSDDSDQEDSIIQNKKICESYNVEYIHDGKRKGVAKNKNACILALIDCDHFFLFDDDCYPIKNDWAEHVIKCHQESGVHHFNLLEPQCHNLIKETQYSDFIIQEYHMVGGVFMYLSKEVVNKVGAFNKDYDVYGFEHASYTYRVFKSGLHNGLGINLTIKDLQEYIFSLDYSSFANNINHKMFLELPVEFKANSASSIGKQEAANSISNNHRILAQDCNGPIYREF